MSATKKQIKANRQNAKKSTGPKTDKGKAIVSQNSLKHGFHAKDVVIDSDHLSEDEVEYNLLVESLIDELNPESAFQRYLVNKLANCLWRCRRIVIAETAQINKQLNNIDSNMKFRSDVREFTGIDIDEDEYDQELLNLIGIKSIPNKSFNRNLLIYEMRLERQMTRTYKLLRMLQMQTKLHSLQNHYNQKKSEKTNPIPGNPMEDIIL